MCEWVSHIRFKCVNESLISDSYAWLSQSYQIHMCDWVSHIRFICVTAASRNMRTSHVTYVFQMTYEWRIHTYAFTHTHSHIWRTSHVSYVFRMTYEWRILTYAFTLSITYEWCHSYVCMSYVWVTLHTYSKCVWTCQTYVMIVMHMCVCVCVNAYECVRLTYNRRMSIWLTYKNDIHKEEY